MLKQGNEILASMNFSNEIDDNNFIEDINKDTISNKMKVGILGFAVGDALGVPIEFINRENLQKSLVIEMTVYGTYKVPEGT